MYTVNGQKFDSFLAAIAAAKPIRADVIQADNGARRWTPGKPAAVRKVRHMLVNADGTQTEFSRVGR